MNLENGLGQIQFGALVSLKQQDKNEQVFHIERALDRSSYQLSETSPPTISIRRAIAGNPIDEFRTKAPAAFLLIGGSG